MTGIEYYIWYNDIAHQNFHIIKQLKQSATKVIPMAAYYILQGNIYQAPDLFSLLSSRLVCTDCILE
jgi:hypothetical protein